jgi:serine protease Do
MRSAGCYNARLGVPAARWSPSMRCILTLAVVLSLASLSDGQDRKTKVLNDRDRFAKNEVWLYNDLDEAFAEAKKSKKPLLVVLRCVPCEACSHFDKQLLDEQEQMRDLLDQFVCVRVVKANGLDLSLFQFDYDQSFHAMFFNPDRTIYGRFGTRSQNKEDDDMTMEGFRQAMKGVLALHKDYPANQASLAGKTGGKPLVEVPEAFPSLKGKYKAEIDYEGAIVASCIHCHQVRDAERIHYRTQGKELPEHVLYPYPLPSVVGLTFDPTQAATITSVEPESIAAAAGLTAGDQIIALNKQPMISIADVQWVLHNAPASGELAVDYRRGKANATTKLELPAGWRKKSDLAWRPTTWDLRRMALGGLWLKDLSDEERSKRGLASDTLALWVKHLGEYNEHAVAKNAGFRKDDVLVAVDGSDRRWSETEMIDHALRKRPGEKLAVTVLRGKERVELKLPVQ